MLLGTNNTFECWQQNSQLNKKERKYHYTISVTCTKITKHKQQITRNHGIMNDKRHNEEAEITSQGAEPTTQSSKLACR